MSEHVEKQRKNNSPRTRLGGITGKGWLPGQSGNPKGRPRNEACLTSLLRERITRMEDDGRSAAEKLADALVELALEGNMVAIKEIFDRVEGRPVTRVADVEGPGPIKRLIIQDCPTE